MSKAFGFPEITGTGPGDFSEDATEIFFVLISYRKRNLLNGITRMAQHILRVFDPDMGTVITEGFSDDIVEAAAEIAVAHPGVPCDFGGIQWGRIVLVDVNPGGADSPDDIGGVFRICVEKL